MRYEAILSLLIFALPAVLTTEVPDRVLLLPTETVPFLPAWQQLDEYMAMGTPSCEQSSITKDGQSPLGGEEMDCLVALPLRRRQGSTNCPISYSNCYGQGAPGLCCQPSAVCSADMAGNVACCPVGAACTGTISAINTATLTSTSNSGGYSSTTSTTNGFASSTTTSTSGPAATTSGGFIITASDASLILPKFPGLQVIRTVTSVSKAFWTKMRGTES